MNAFLKFNKGVLKMSVAWRVWLGLLVTMNLIIPLVFISRLEAQLVLGAMLIGFGLMTLLTALSGFSRLLGAGHILWIPLVLFLYSRLGQIPGDNVFGVWIRVLIVVDALSLVFDAADVVRYIAGDRAETVKGL